MRPALMTNISKKAQSTERKAQRGGPSADILVVLKRRMGFSTLSYVRYMSPLVFHPCFSFFNGFHWGTSFRLYLHGFREYSLAVQRKKRSNTLKGTGERKTPPRRVGLSNMNDRLLAAEIFVYKARFTSMGRPRCGLPPFAQLASLKQALRLTPSFILLSLRAPANSKWAGSCIV